MSWSWDTQAPAQTQENKEGNVEENKEGETKDESQNIQVDQTTTDDMVQASGPHIKGEKETRRLSSMGEL